MFNFTHFGSKLKGAFQLDRYKNNNIAVIVMSESEDGGYLERYATVSTNTDNPVGEDEFVSKEYSENEGLVQQFIDEGYFEDTGKVVQVGYTTGRVLRLLDKAKEMTTEETMY